MTVREVPRRFVYSCDRCSKEHEQVNSTGHYANSTPPGWSKLRYDSILISASPKDSYGHVEYLLCEECSVAATTTIGQLFAPRGEPQDAHSEASPRSQDLRTTRSGKSSRGARRS